MDERVWSWLGSNAPALAAPTVERRGPFCLGVYGGATAGGASKNEDGALIWRGGHGRWELAALLDAHNSAQSAALLLDTLAAEGDELRAALGAPVGVAFTRLHARLLARFQSPAFRARCREVQGEASLLIVARRAQFVWWLSIGDCSLYLLHPDLARLGQYALNQRSFFEWVGAVNTFDLPVPCYASGVREPRAGRNVIVMTTDGLLEYPGSPFANAHALYERLTSPGKPVDWAVGEALRAVHTGRGRDSATIVAWAYENDLAGQQPSE